RQKESALCASVPFREGESAGARHSGGRGRDVGGKPPKTSARGRDLFSVRGAEALRGTEVAVLGAPRIHHDLLEDDGGIDHPKLQGMRARRTDLMKGGGQVDVVRRVPLPLTVSAAREVVAEVDAHH